MDSHHFSRQHRAAIAIEAYCTPALICRLHEVAQYIPQLKRTGKNFNIWETHLKIMIRNLTGSSDYLLHELHKHNPRLSQAVFDLIMCSLAQCIINCANLPEEILDNIVDMVYHQSFEENAFIKERKLYCRIQTPKPGLRFEVSLVVNQKLQRLCLPNLWQKITFSNFVPAPMSLWMHNLLLKHSILVEGHQIHSNQFLESKRSLYNDTSAINTDKHRYGIGLLNVLKIFKLCRSLEPVSVYIPLGLPVSKWVSGLTVCLKGAFQLLPQLQHLNLNNFGELSDFEFVQKEFEKKSLGWHLAQLQKL
ncbi:hypothetical protein DFH28DRAFT_1078949 [Melampsora americana]|nr:hypothetical protein DFH28DRAFT_1078949 [Melampsora americana]